MSKTDAAQRNSLAPGTRFGRYEVLAEIASGGMATVYLGRALGAAGFQRQVAIKVMHPHVAKDEEFVAMFMDEARLAARLRHPNAVPTLDLENGDDGLFLVMEYVEGDVLLNLMRTAMREKRKIPVPVVLRIVLDVLNGLHAAHELTGDRGEPLRLVHRDISPHNVLVGVDGICRITDFGIARAEERVGETRDGQIKGKLAYMAPEQTSGNPVDRRADLFATGVVLWECLTGRRLFKGENDGEVLRNLLVNPIPKLRDLVPDLPAALEEVCAKALERDPDQRYATAAQFAEALEEAGGSIGIASARAVSKHVLEISGAKVSTLQTRVRQLTADGTTTSAVRSSMARNRLTDPDQTVKRDDGDLRLSNSAKRQSVPQPVGAAVESAGPEIQMGPSPRRRSAFILIAAVTFSAALAISSWAFFRGRRAATSPLPVLATTATAPQPAQNPGAPTLAENPGTSAGNPAAPGAPAEPSAPEVAADTAQPAPEHPQPGRTTASAGGNAGAPRPRPVRAVRGGRRGGGQAGGGGGAYNPESM